MKEKSLLATMAYGVSYSTLVVVHGDMATTDEDWDRYVGAARTLAYDNLLVYATEKHPGPTPVQRRKGADALGSRDPTPHVSVMLHNWTLRHVVTAFNWMLGSTMRAFRPDDWDGAFDYLKVPAEHRHDIRRETLALLAELAPTSTRSTGT